MFRNKPDVDKVVAGILYKAKTEHERNLRCLHIAQLYFKAHDYESAQRYVTMYLSVRDDSATAHKLLGQSLEGLGQKEKALDAYKKSLKLEPEQYDLILKVCELLCDKDVQFDPVLARYWADRASSMFPHSPPVFMLKEKLLASDSTVTSKDLEGLLHAELKAKPMDINVRIKLLKLYADSGRAELALKNASEVESRLPHVNSFNWYQCIHNICKTYNRENFAKCGFEFYIQWLSALDKMCSLCLADNTSLGPSDAAECIYNLDQTIYLANQCSKQPDILREFLKHISAELAYQIGILLMKNEKKVNTHWKETKRFVSPLFLLAFTSPAPQPEQSWALSLKDNYQKLVQQWVYQTHCRNVQAGYLLITLVKENHSEKMFLDKVNHFVSSDWRRQIYEKAFSSLREINSSTSYFMTGAELAKVPLKIPHSNSLKPSSYVPSFENCYYGSLHHLTWLGLRALRKTSVLEIKLPSFHTSCFKTLQFTINNLNNVSVETINRLDVDSFLYATVFSTASILQDQKTNGFYEDRPQILPADITSPLCSTEQEKWWSNLCSLIKGGTASQMSNNESMSDLRFSLQRGLEVIRGEGLPTFLMVALARTFAARAQTSSAIEESDGCHARALHLWQLAYPMLERLASNKPLITIPKANTLFENSLKEITTEEAKKLLEEAKFFIGTHFMNTQQYERAVEEFKSIKTPEAIFNLANVYQKWAEEQMDGVKGEEITSDIRCRHGVLATKAKDYLLVVKSMIKNDHKHPLHANVESKIADVEDMLARIEPENGVSERDVNGTSDGSGTYGSDGSPVTEALNIMTSSNQRNRLHAHHTSTPRRIQDEKTNRFNMSELIDLMSVQQSTNQLKMQQVLEQIRLILDKLDNVVSEQRSQRNLIDGLNSKLNSFESEMKTNISDIKKDMKRPDLCNMFDEDDYTDEMLQYQSYSQYYGAPQRVVQNAAAPPPAVPYVNQPYYSPRIDPICSGFYGQQGVLPFNESQQLPDFLRQQKVSQPLLHSLQPGLQPSLNLSAAVPGPSRLGTTPVMPSNVLISGSETLPSVTPTFQPALSVNIPSSQRLPTPGVPHNFQIPLPPQPKPTLTIEERVIEEETPPPTYDPLPDYKPIVPLPDEIEVHTGEENEEVLFEKRAKLYRHVDKMWKERGVGNIKILKNKNTGKVRILMRREQVHKICANHYLHVDMYLQPKNNTENAWIWYAKDYADEKMESEKFCVRFKTSEESEEFKRVFDKAREELKAVKDIPSADQDHLNESKSLSTSSSTASKVHLSDTPKSTDSSAVSNFTSKPLLFTSESKTQDASSQQSVSQGPTNLGGFTFSLAQPKLKAPELPKPEKEVSKEQSPFTKFNFSLTTPSKDATSIFSALGHSNKTEMPNPFSKSLFSSNENKSKFSELQNPFSKTIFTSNENKSAIPPFSSSQSPLAQDPKKDKDSEKESANYTSNESSELLEATSKEEEAYNFVPTATFEPVISLPKLVTIKTGEENEDIIFEDRAQLYRYCKETRQWKERGVGQMKILKDRENLSFRFLMRREQVLKVCCNHRITKDLELKPATSSDKAFTWAAIDHSEEKPSDEIFSLRFKSSEQALRFKDAVESVKTELSTRLMEPNTCSVDKNNKLPLSSLLKKPPGSWSCTSCYLSNNAENSSCLACGSPNPSKVDDKLKETKSEAPKQESSIPSKNILAEKTTFNQAHDKTNKSKPLLSEQFKPKPGTWECNTCYIRNNADVEVCKACNTVKPGCVIKKTEESVSTKLTFNFGIPQVTEINSFSGAANTSSGQLLSAPFSFGSPSISTGTTSNLFPSKESGTSLTSDKFSFDPKFTFGSATPKETFFGISGSGSSFEKTGFPFSSSSVANQSVNPDTTFGSKTFQFSMPMPSVSSPPGNKSLNDESGYDPEEEEDHVQFQPIVPLPDKIDVITGEEDEEVLYSHRAKLYRFDSTSKEWKERGLGDVKILQHKETKKIRFLMRREPVMKVCLNHLITSDISLRPMKEDGKTWIWYAVDYSEGTQSNEQFAIRFKNDEIAKEFKNEFEKAKVMATELTSSVQTPVAKHEKRSEIVSTQPEIVASSSDSDVELVSEQKAPPELVEKALSLQLPPNYYCYLEKPPCPGCCGCEPDIEDESTAENEKKQDVLKEDKQNQKEGNKENNLIKEKSGDKRSESFTQSTFSKVETSSVSTIFGGSNVVTKSAGFTFAQAFNSTSDEPPKTTSGFLFGGQTSFQSSNPQMNMFGSGFSSPVPNYTGTLFGAKDIPSFGSIASGEQPTSGFLFPSGSLPSFGSLAEGGTFMKGQGDFKWEGAGQQVFSCASIKKNESSGSENPALEKVDDDDNEEEDNEENKEESDPYFEPQVPLPAEIQVRTGEEDEDVLFAERGTLYRFSKETKEWKERGVGEMKVLKNKSKHIYRLLMRREQVHKIVCNHLIKEDFSLKNKTDKAFNWTAFNYYDDEYKPEQLCIRFKTPEIALKFKDVIDGCLNKLKENAATTN